MKNAINTLLVFAIILPLVLLFWPFATWHGIMALILRIMPAIAMQALVCRICKLNIVRAIPALLTGALAAWGTYLFFHLTPLVQRNCRRLDRGLCFPFHRLPCCFARLPADRE